MSKIEEIILNSLMEADCACSYVRKHTSDHDCPDGGCEKCMTNILNLYKKELRGES